MLLKVGACDALLIRYFLCQELLFTVSKNHKSNLLLGLSYKEKKKLLWFPVILVLHVKNVHVIILTFF